MRFFTRFKQSASRIQVIPNSVTSIEDGAFAGCSSLSYIKIPESVTNIGDWTFQDTLWLEERRKENPLVIVNESLIDGETAEGEIVIPDNVKHICGFCFRKCTKITSVKIPEGVVSIGSFAFSDCTELIKIELPKSISSIGYKAFIGCKSLINIIIPDSVENIDECAF